MRVLLLARYSWAGNSSRHRSLKYLPYLESQGIQTTTAPLVGEDYIDALYSGRRRSAATLAGAYLTRALKLLSVRNYDLIWIERELFPMIPAIGESLLRVGGIRYVVDYDDAIFHNYDRHRSGVVRMLLGRKIDRVMRHASLVVAGNRYLAERALQAGAGRVEILPTAIDPEANPLQTTPAGGPFTIGWIGSPLNARYLKPLRPALEELTREPDTRLVLIGARDVDLPGVHFERLPWAEESEAADIGSFDIGIMPMPDAPFERGKCGFKILQYFAAGRPAVASPVGVNSTIIRDGENGFLARTPDEWIRAITTLRRDPEGRRRMGLAGRTLVEHTYSTHTVGPRLAALLRDAASG